MQQGYWPPAQEDIMLQLGIYMKELPKPLRLSRLHNLARGTLQQPTRTSQHTSDIITRQLKVAACQQRCFAPQA
jgi:hypothetical protein